MSTEGVIDAALRVNILSEALPYLRQFSGKVIVIKYGGSAQTDDSLKDQFASDIVLLKYTGVLPVIVHGGGEQVSSMMDRLGKVPQFVEGLRITDSETMDIVEMVLGGKINKEIVANINRHGGQAVGITGKDGGFMRAVKRKPMRQVDIKGREKLIDLGLVGEIEDIDTRLITTLLDKAYIPVVAPVGVTEDGVSLNINADIVAGAVAAKLKSEKIIFMTDVPGLLKNPKDRNSLIPTIRLTEVERLKQEGVIAGGMLPKIEAAVRAVEAGVAKAHFIDGTAPHALILELFTDSGVGTQIVRD